MNLSRLNRLRGRSCCHLSLPLWSPILVEGGEGAEGGAPAAVAGQALILSPWWDV